MINKTLCKAGGKIWWLDKKEQKIKGRSESNFYGHPCFEIDFEFEQPIDLTSDGNSLYVLCQSDNSIRLYSSDMLYTGSSFVLSSIGKMESIQFLGDYLYVMLEDGTTHQITKLGAPTSFTCSDGSYFISGGDCCARV